MAARAAVWPAMRLAAVLVTAPPSPSSLEPSSLRAFLAEIWPETSAAAPPRSSLLRQQAARQQPGESERQATDPWVSPRQPDAKERLVTDLWGVRSQLPARAAVEARLLRRVGTPPSSALPLALAATVRVVTLPSSPLSPASAGSRRL